MDGLRAPEQAINILAMTLLSSTGLSDWASACFLICWSLIPGYCMFCVQERTLNQSKQTMSETSPVTNCFMENQRSCWHGGNCRAVWPYCLFSCVPKEWKDFEWWCLDFNLDVRPSILMHHWHSKINFEEQFRTCLALPTFEIIISDAHEAGGQAASHDILICHQS